MKHTKRLELHAFKKYNAQGRETVEFNDIRPEDMRRADLNPHIEAYWNYGTPVIIGGHAKKYKDNWGRHSIQTTSFEGELIGSSVPMSWQKAWSTTVGEIEQHLRSCWGLRELSKPKNQSVWPV